MDDRDLGISRDVDAGTDGSMPSPTGAGDAGDTSPCSAPGACTSEEPECAEGEPVDGVCRAPCPGCSIDGECIIAGAVRADNVCERCDPAASATGWSPAAGECDDGLFCTTGDTCQAGVCTGGAPFVCEDGAACNGVSECDEASDRCTVPATACAPGQLCDVALDSCVDTCAGCEIAGSCVAAGSAQLDNGCMVCDPAEATTAYVPAVGRACGAAATECSDADTCDASGSCQPNHRPAGSECGSGAASDCDSADSCDGAGNCTRGTATNGSMCNDGLFCTVGDSCQAGVCTAPMSRTCGNFQTCDESGDRCVCQGCQIGNDCVAPGALNPGNPCQICDPMRNSVGFSPNVAATCGAGPSACSQQDTCNASGQCVANDLQNGAACGPGGSQFCQQGACVGCDDAANPNALCASRSAAAPVCDLTTGTCAACVPSSCSGSTPRCDPSVGCLPCSEHSDCPSTACHLSGPLAGSCFAQGDTVNVATSSQLETQLGILLPGRPSAIRLAAATFTTSNFLDIAGDGVEVAIIGQPGTVLSGGPMDGTPFLMSASFNTIVYVANLAFRNGPVRALGSSQDSIMWVDDVEISGYPTGGMTTTGEVHLRRDRIRSAGTALLVQGGALFMQNTSLGSGGTLGMATLNSPRIDITYSTIAGSSTSLDCNASPGPSGQLRNSIILATGDPSIGGNACDLLTYTRNVMDQAGFGNTNSVVNGFDASWFSDAASGDFHLTNAGAQAVGNIASLGSGDPPLDIDGQARPATGRVGVDQR